MFRSHLSREVQIREAGKEGGSQDWCPEGHAKEKH